MVLGIVSGMRTTAGLFFLPSLVSRHEATTALVRFFKKRPVGVALGIMGASELVIDKLPQTPSRIQKGGVAARAVAAAICGAAIYQSENKKATTGAMVASVAAIASAYTFYYLRKKLGEKTGIPDPYIGAAEDALAIGCGVRLARK